MAQSYENLNIWKESVTLAATLYKMTKTFPKNEQFGIVSQIRRAVISISSNIAEGSSRRSKKEFTRFIDIAIGSLNEVESLLLVSTQLNFVGGRQQKEVGVKIKELGTLLGGFRKYLQK